MVLKIYPKMSGEKISKAIRDIIDTYLDQGISANDAAKRI